MSKGNQLSEKQKIPPPFHQKKDLSLNDVREVAQKSDKKINITKNYDDDSLNSSLLNASMGGAIGFKTTLLFEDKLSNNDARFDRLERVVQDLSNQFIKIEPAIERLIKIDNDLGLLTMQLEVLLKKEADQEPRTVPVNDYVAESVNKIIPLAGGNKVQAPIDNASIDYSGPSLYAIRLSDHQSKARIVMDSSERFEFEPILDGKQLVLSANIWSAIEQGSVNIQNMSSVVSNIETDSQTGSLVLKLSRPIQETRIGRIAPSDDNPDYRTYIDLVY